MTINKRLENLEEMFTKHLQQSGYIHADIAWLKKAYWTLAGAGIAFNVALVGAIIAFLLRS